MDESIKRLKTTTFFGRRFRRQQLQEVKRAVELFPALSRKELAQTVCEHLNWRTDSGENSVAACLKMLEQLQSEGVFRLPAKDETKVRGARRPLQWSDHSEPGEALVAVLKELEPLELQLVGSDRERAQWNELVDRYHYLGYRQPMGYHLRYFIVDRQGRRLGCLLFQQAATKLVCRERWIGWPAERFKKRLKRVVQNARFLIFPWVQVPNLASKALSLAGRRLADDWQARWGVRPLLMETFVEVGRYRGTSYRAAGWERIGETVKRSDKPLKAVYVKPLQSDARELLRGAAKPKKRVRPRAPAKVAGNDRFVAMWRDFIGIVATVAEQYDRRWQQRRRVLNTLLIMLFVLRLVFSKNHQGYQITINEMWDQCRLLGVALPQSRPPAAASMCSARAKLDEQAFKELHRQILARLDEDEESELSRRRWCGRQLLAVDGTKINLPRQLLKAGYALPSKQSYYPQGLVSCLYRLGDRMPVDFELLASSDERLPVLTHLKRVRAGKVVVYDRGYFSYELLRQHALRAVDCIFRLQRNSAALFDAFINSKDQERIIDFSLRRSAALRWRRAHPGETLQPIRVRCVKYRAGGNEYYLATTLLDAKRFPRSELSAAYHGRWGIEELYKVSKRLVEIEQFHSHSERGVKQELYAHFVVLLMARTFGNALEDELNATSSSKQPQIRANFKNVLVTMARNVEALMLGHWQLASTAVSNILQSIDNCVQKERPGRSYPRRSRRPDPRFRNANRKQRTA